MSRGGKNKEKRKKKSFQQNVYSQDSQGEKEKIKARKSLYKRDKTILNTMNEKSYSQLFTSKCVYLRRTGCKKRHKEQYFDNYRYKLSTGLFISVNKAVKSVKNYIFYRVFTKIKGYGKTQVRFEKNKANRDITNN